MVSNSYISLTSILTTIMLFGFILSTVYNINKVKYALVPAMPGRIVISAITINA